MAESEQGLIPYAPSDLRGERLLVLAPHPDDEIIGCGGLVALHAREHRKVLIVVATDGAEARPDETDAVVYRDQRETESIRGLSILGVDAPRFLRIPDRSLDEQAPAFSDQIESILLDFRPDLVILPSPIEIHPDHRALCQAVVTLIQSKPAFARDLPLCRFAFCEISQPIRPNTLVDITDVVSAKLEALEAHTTQTSTRNYGGYAAGLNQYRTMTLASGTSHAEGYWVIGMKELATWPWSRLRHAVAGSEEPRIQVSEPLPITVVMRTRDRLGLLREALESVSALEYPHSVVVVNDGGTSPRDPLSGLLQGATLLEHETSRGRSAAGNAGVRAATTPFVVFLDDDDLFAPEHLTVLANGAVSGAHRALYTDAVSVTLRPGPEGTWLEQERLRNYAQDFDRDLLLLDNFIPLPTLLLRRDDYLDLCGFDETLDLFEDWDYLLRLSNRGSFLRIPRVTCEIRHFEGSTSAVLASPEGSDAFRAAKLAVWKRHEADFGPSDLARAIEKWKRVLSLERHERAMSQGRAQHLERDVARISRDLGDTAREAGRLVREEQRLANELGQSHERIGELTFHSADLERQRESLLTQLDAARTELREAAERFTAERAAAAAERAEAAERETSLQNDVRVHSSASKQKDDALRATYAEIERLNALLQQIHASRTWKLHSVLERLRGRG